MSTIVSSLTEDLLMEVLSRLPIKYIVQFIKNELCGVVMGFGYDGVCEKYKLVRIEYFYDLDGSDFMTDFNRVEVKVYTLGSNVWRLVDDTPCCYIGNINRVAHVDGVLYWIGLRGVGVGSWKSIVSFDLRNEKFGEVSWPAFEDRSYRDLGLGVLRGSLCTFSFHLERVDIWMIKNYGVKGTWTKHFSIARSTKHLEPLFLLKSGEILLQMGLGSLLFYDPASDLTKAPSVSGIPDRFRTSTYVESLVPIASLMGMPGNSLATTISTGIKNKLHEEK
ncbi:hypothetical protein IFM89_029745 [Coptis chinensis]|uniref:F-box associated beta-propeller type 1 domain-containing protein n=1 Tax=Coptis chinensis TaxID=261450 RepID=A0A835I7U8_9MAGN|nr:hypothetical protein IFM89_029745 [Coptis chinensis]